MANKALVIDDDVSTLQLMRYQLELEEFEVSTAENGRQALEYVKDINFDIVLTDLQLPDMGGIEIVKQIKEVLPETEIIMITGFGSTEKAIEATKAGAFYYVEKPVDFDELLILIEKAVERKQQAAEIRELRGKLSSRHSYEGIIGASKPMQNIYEMIEGVAQSDANILILGESGTGKEVIANAIHFKSLRANKPFIKVNCSALPKDLIESELFGHTKGAFTGATGEKVGYIGRANGGSLLLDEIGEMPIDLQPKLLRVLQDKVYYKVGSDKPQEVDFRLISATNRNPFDSIQEGTMREDLYYRINTIEIKIPPLRDRMEDVPMLAEHFLEIYSEKYGKNVKKFSQSAFSQMLSYTWRGNVRELQNVIERAVLLTKKNIIEDLNIPSNTTAPVNFVPVEIPASISVPQESFQESNVLNLISEENLFEEIGEFIVGKLKEPVDGETQEDIFNSIEYGVVLAALRKTSGNKQAAANLLGLYRPRLYGMIKRHNLDGKL
jgi:DNA-binding NtrC family response regulator